MPRSDDPPLRVDHLIHWVPDLDRALTQYRELGFAVHLGGRHERLGTRNGAWNTQDLAAYGELLTVEDATRAAAAFGPRWPAIAQCLAAGGGAGAFALWASNVPAVVARCRSQAIPVDEPEAGTITRADGGTASWMQAQLHGVSLWTPHLINYGHATVTATVAMRRQIAHWPLCPWTFAKLVLETPDPATVAPWLATVVDGAATPRGGNRYELALAGCALEVVPGPADRVMEVVLEGATPPEVRLPGCATGRADALAGQGRTF